MRVKSLVLLIAALLVPALLVPAQASAKPTEPTADLPGSKDSALLGRFKGSLIVSYEHKGQAEFALPLAPLAKVAGRKDNSNNNYFEPKQKKDLTGAYTRLVYLLPPERSSLEVLGNYKDEITKQGGKVLFQCKGDECGGNPQLGVSGGGGNMSLSMYLYPVNTLTDKEFSLGTCLVRPHLSDRRYLAAELPKQGAHVSVYTYSVAPDACEGVMPNRTVALVQIVEGQAAKNEMVVANANELARSISEEGRAAVYGIYFDSSQAEVKAESSPTLEQIAKLLQGQPALKVLIVGHTDNVGGYRANLDLSERRAKAVVAALSSKYKITSDRLKPVGVSSASPLGSNKTDEGRAKNRRVEIVEQ